MKLHKNWRCKCGYEYSSPVLALQVGHTCNLGTYPIWRWLKPCDLTESGNPGKNVHPKDENRLAGKSSVPGTHA